MAKTRRIVLEVDDLDHEAIVSTIARFQVGQRVGDRTPLPDGEGNYTGRFLAEICRSWCEQQDWIAAQLGPDGGG